MLKVTAQVMLTVIFASQCLIFEAIGNPANCPQISEDDLKAIAKEEKLQKDGKPFHLISGQETKNNYNKHLIESSSALKDFLEKSKTPLTVTHHVNSHQNAMMRKQSYCPYFLQKGLEVAVVALASNSLVSPERGHEKQEDGQ